MSDAFTGDIEGMLRAALTPVEPPERLIERFETTLNELADLAADELENWELRSMKDPRNWVRPVAAAAIGAGAGAGLIALRVRRNHRTRVAEASSTSELAEETLKAMMAEARRMLDN
ncbi:MAG TPA: hypothetical protein PKB03_07005 [Baekduia sp.]|nr:hypothetical protein [Baekduia sp.]